MSCSMMSTKKNYFTKIESVDESYSLAPTGQTEESIFCGLVLTRNLELAVPKAGMAFACFESMQNLNNWGKKQELKCKKYDGILPKIP